jgi:3-oxocholest-4-en-26-oate---CoA ligase
VHPATMLEAVARAFADDSCLIQGDATLSWGEFEDRAARLARTLADTGVRPNDTVGIMLYNDPEFLITALAALKVGAAPVNLNTRYLAEELRPIIADAAPAAIVFDGSVRERLRPAVSAGTLLIRVGGDAADGEVSFTDAIATDALPPQGRTGDEPWIHFTGGTTGRPKGVRNTVGRFATGILTATFGDDAAPRTANEFEKALARGPEQRGVSLAIAPLSHSTGFMLGALAPMFVGSAVVLPERRSFDAEASARLIESHRVTDLAIAGEVFARAFADALDAADDVGAAIDIGSLRRIRSSGMTCVAHTKSRLLARAPRAEFREILGATEGFAGSSVAVAGDVPPTGRFTPAPGTKILDDRGDVVPFASGVPGMLAVSGETIGTEYLGDPERSAAVYRMIDGSVHAVTGDRAVIDSDGFLWALGRDATQINSGGMKVSAEEVEEAILDDPAVIDCLVLGVPDPMRGQNVAALLHVGETFDLDSLRGVLRGRMASFKVPSSFTLVDAVPRDRSGKPDYRRAGELFYGRTTTGGEDR